MEISPREAQKVESPVIQKISRSIQRLNLRNDITGIRLLADSLEEALERKDPDFSVSGELYYFTGVCNLLTGEYKRALLWLKRSVDVKHKLNQTDDYLAKSAYNIGVAYNYLGDFTMMGSYMLEYISISKSLYGDNSPEVASGYTYLVSASIELQEYEKSIEYAFAALDIINTNQGALKEDELSNLYIAIGTCYARLSDYTKARIYYEKAESVLSESQQGSGENYINLLNNLAITYRTLGLADKENDYFEKGIALTEGSNSALAYNLVNTYAVTLGNDGNTRKGENLLVDLLAKAKNHYGAGSRNYIEVLKNYAEYLRLYLNDNQRALEAYSKCMSFLEGNDDEVILRDPVTIGYALTLSASGEPQKALQKIQELLFPQLSTGISDKIYENPDLASMKADRGSLEKLNAKHEILWDIYSETNNYEVIEAAAATSELLISLLEKVRINISEEESRLLLGDRYRNSYLVAINDAQICFNTRREAEYLEKTFRYMEKSKVAGLLAATRELKAVQFHIPDNMAALEKSLQREISLYNARINSENAKDPPDITSISEWNEKILKATQSRDSLILVYEKNYPEYHAIKYNTMIPQMKEITAILGWNNNYLNYVVSDSLLYIFLVNRKHQELVTIKIDSGFFRKIRNFRELLSYPVLSGNARNQFESYQKIGHDLYKILIEPVRDYFISDKILISPDNILSYLPFETLLYSEYSGTAVLYRELSYLMNDFSISYAYSAAFMEELVKRNYGRKKELIAFAPHYGEAISIDSIIMIRQMQDRDFLYKLPYALEEAEYVSGITGGKLFINHDAKESVYKSESPKYDIIHLAMHTFVNDRYPMSSAMIFSQTDDSPEDGMLYTFEVYGIPLKARMVVLSSCNTGTGMLFSGEGILSLARGFLYSGSQSVVMSMWEIEDKSGTEIVKMFYDNLKRGKTKSESLKKARTMYLKNASQLKSHPYFWSSLVVYGDNTRIYRSIYLFIAGAGILLVAALVLGFYFMKRRYS
ncbi:MAG: CHAT domain-containing protein [Bacteroidales bacterium]|nr:CHAT domain-containing protein [Bacteroidales bacterium]